MDIYGNIIYNLYEKKSKLKLNNIHCNLRIMVSTRTEIVNILKVISVYKSCVELDKMKEN